MSIMRTRSGRSGILATIILMFSIVMFIGTLFWLMTDTGFLGGTSGSSLFKPVTVPENHPKTLNQTINMLQHGGCMVVYYTKEYEGGYESVSYEVFMEEALDAKVVYRVENSMNEMVLLVEKQGKIHEWVFEG